MSLVPSVRSSNIDGYMVYPVKKDCCCSSWLEERWQALTTIFPPKSFADQVFADLAARYSEDARYYHNLNHIQKMLKLSFEYKHLAQDWTAVQFAIWFHDAIYAAGAADNEQQSAQLARCCCEAFQLSPKTILKIEKLIIATQHRSEPPKDMDCSLLVDLDLAILGAGPAEYAAYAQAVRQEFGHVPDVDFIQGRFAVLFAFNQRKQIYQLEPFGERFERPARKNIAWELANLKP